MYCISCAGDEYVNISCLPSSCNESGNLFTLINYDDYGKAHQKAFVQKHPEFVYLASRGKMYSYAFIHNMVLVMKY
jgi:hypothetical protein